MFKEAGVRFYLYSVERFIERAQEFLKITGDEADRVVDEVRAVSNEEEAKNKLLQRYVREMQASLETEEGREKQAIVLDAFQRTLDETRRAMELFPDMSVHLEAQRRAYVYYQVGTAILSLIDANPTTRHFSLRAVSEELRRRGHVDIADLEVGEAVSYLSDKGCLKIGGSYVVGNPDEHESHVFDIVPKKILFWIASFKRDS